MAEALPQTFMSVQEAREYYDLFTRDASHASPLDQELAANGLAKIAMPLKDGDFEQLASSYKDCIDDCPSELGKTYYLRDHLYGNDVGHQRKEQKIDSRTGLQIADPKNYIHFTEGCKERWGEQLATGPRSLQQLFKIGHEIHQVLRNVARDTLLELEGTHPNITLAHFGPSYAPLSRTFMRVNLYDGYVPHSNMGAVAKAHNDKGGLTIQAYADAPGFWGAKDGYKGEKQYFETRDGEAYFFAGATHRKLYGSQDRFKPLWHGVDRIIPKGTTYMPPRSSVVLFIDAPRVDAGVNSRDTLPYLEDIIQASDLPAQTIGRSALQNDAV